MSALGFAIPVAGLIIVVMVVGLSAIYQLGRRAGTDSSSTHLEKLHRESDYVEVVAEDDNGYGTAVRDVDDGVDVVSFDDRHEIYQRTWVPGSDLDALADAVSVHACQKECGADE